MNAMLKPVSLVDVKNGEPITTTLQMAIGLGVMHASVIKMVRTYLPDVQEFGKVIFESSFETETLVNSGFEIRNSNQGRHTRYAILNEQQATFVLTLMRNSPKVIEFKKSLVKAFFAARALLQTDYFSLIQQHSAIEAKLDLEKDIASQCGKGLSAWKKKRDCLEAALIHVERQLQPCLDFTQAR